VYVITSRSKRSALVGRQSGGSDSSHSRATSASARKYASAVASLAARSIGHRAAYTIISRITGAAASTRTRSSMHATRTGSKKIEHTRTRRSVVWCARPAGIHAACWGGSR
jgi:hypothetical protein